jgi:hypothetical protein
MTFQGPAGQISRFEVRVQAVMAGNLPEPAIYPGGALGFTAFGRAQALGLADDICGWSPNTVTKMFCTRLPEARSEVRQKKSKNDYEDAGISGSRGRDRRPAFDRLLKDATRRRFHMISAWSVDRLGRSLQDLVNFLSEVHGAGVDLYLHQQAIDTTTPSGKAMFGCAGSSPNSRGA